MQTMFPEAVFTLWWATILLAIVVFVPLSLYVLHALKRASASVRSYAHGSLVAGGGIGTNIAALPALDSTIAAATEVLTAAESVAAKLETIATVLESRAAGGR